MDKQREDFEAWVREYGNYPRRPELKTFDGAYHYLHTESEWRAWQAAQAAQPAQPFKKLSDDEVLWIAQSHGIDVYASNPLAFYADLISTTPAQPDHSELVKDAARYAHVLECDYLATKTYLPDTTREERYAKLREKHDAGRKAIGETME